MAYIYFVSGERGSKKLKRTNNRTYLLDESSAAWQPSPHTPKGPVACGESGGNGLRPAHRCLQKGAKQAERARTQRKMHPTSFRDKQQ